VGVRVSVLTPSIPERASYLEQARASVQAQTMTDFRHHVFVDDEHRGCAWTVNRLAALAGGEWLFILADDDLMLPGCLAEHLAATTVPGGCDIVYAPPLVWGAEPGGYRQGPPAIPSASLIRMSLWRQLGGYDESRGREEDRDFYTRALAAGARFIRREGQPTWVYRIHRGSKSWAGMEQTWVA
jgi:glycosyltransferase involved in cell wall biosynthesis